MWLFENSKRGKKVRIVKVCGKVVYIVTHGYKRRVQRYLGNLVSTCKVEKDKVETKTIKVLNKIVSKRVVDEDYKREYLFGHLTKEIDLKQKFMKKYGKYFEGYNDIFILNANSGEIYLFLTYVIDAFIKKNNCKKPLIVATKKYHMDLIDMLCPEFPHIYLKKCRDFSRNHTKINDKNFYMFFTGDHFIQVEEDIKNSPLDTSHYFYSILEELNISREELNFREVSIPDNIEISMLEKISKTNLNLDNFVFMAPEAASCEEYDNEFWVDLTNEFHKNGIDVFMNIIDDDTEIIGCEYKQCELTFGEAFALAKKSKGVISLRSGLTESLLQTNVPLFSLYTKFRNRCVFNDMDVEYVLSGFGLNKLPNINSKLLHEYNMSEMSNSNVVNEIVNLTKSNEG